MKGQIASGFTLTAFFGALWFDTMGSEIGTATCFLATIVGLGVCVWFTIRGG